MSERPSASKDRVPRPPSEPDLLIPWSRGVGGTASLGIWRLGQAGDLALLGYRLGIFRGRGRGRTPSPSPPFHPICARLERGVMMGSGLSWNEVEAQKDRREAGGLLIDAKHCASGKRGGKEEAVGARTSAR